MAYIGVNNQARKITKSYIGVSNISRRIKKAYIGIGGIARPCYIYKNDNIVYYGRIEDLSVARSELTATTIGDYALFGGGCLYSTTNNEESSTVDVYDSTLTRTLADELSVAREELTATTIGDYALFGGGNKRSGYDFVSTVDVYDSTLTRTLADELSVARSELTATTIGDYALFAGGNSKISSKNVGGSMVSSHYISKGTVDVYDSTLTRTLADELSVAREDLTATTIGDYALFGGGGNINTYTSTVDVYDSTLTRTLADELSVARGYSAATTIGDYALFAGGYKRSGYDFVSTVDVYDSTLTRTLADELSFARGYSAATTIGDYALFAGGAYTERDSDGSYIGWADNANVDVYTYIK